MKKFSLVVAVDQNNGIGKNNSLAWNLPSELKHFSKLTKTTNDPNKKNALIMGRNTWESIPQKSKPLSSRVNLVLSRNTDLELPSNVILASSFDEALLELSTLKDIENIFVIGGARVYEQAILHPSCEKIYLTKIDANFDCDTFFPKIDENKFALISSSEACQEEGVSYRYLVYQGDKNNL